MSKIKIGNAPCSWGILEFAGTSHKEIPFNRMLDELKESQYQGTELGDFGYLPTSPQQLKDELKKRDLTLLGAFVPVALKEPQNLSAGKKAALKVCSLMAQAAEMAEQDFSPYLILADDNGTIDKRTQKAGRITPDMGLSSREWKFFTDAAMEIAQVIKDKWKLKTLFHHHAAGFIETPDEIEHFLSLTDPHLINLVFDTGHAVYGAGNNEVNCLELLKRFHQRISYLHFKDCHPQIAAQTRDQQWDYFRAIKEGLFCELGQGMVNFKEIVKWAQENYSGWILVEQDVLPCMGTPKESAKRNREYLFSLGL